MSLKYAFDGLADLTVDGVKKGPWKTQSILAKAEAGAKAGCVGGMIGACYPNPEKAVKMLCKWYGTEGHEGPTSRCHQWVEGPRLRACFPDAEDEDSSTSRSPAKKQRQDPKAQAASISSDGAR